LGASFFLANFISSFGASALAGAVAAGAGVAGLAAGVAVWANAVNDNADRITIANVFILSFL
jgi:tagatose-1,6-bisphosphate aldolase